MKRGKLPFGVRWQVLWRDGFRCRYCGATPMDARLEIDHFVAVAHGGTDDAWNLLAACRTCNQGKSDEFIDWTCDAGCPRPMCGGPRSPYDAYESQCACKDCHLCHVCFDWSCDKACEDKQRRKLVEQLRRERTEADDASSVAPEKESA